MGNKNTEKKRQYLKRKKEKMLTESTSTFCKKCDNELKLLSSGMCVDCDHEYDLELCGDGWD